MLDPGIPRPAQGRTFSARRRVRLSDMDASGRLRLDAVARFLQDIAIDDVQETGWGMPEHLWFVRRIRIDVVRPFLDDREVELTTWCSGVAAIVFPTTILPAPKLGEEDMEVEVGGRRMPLDEAMSRNIAPGSTAGLPGLVLPAGLTSSGLPVALEFDGPAGADRSLLALGMAMEAVLGPLPPPPKAAAVS